MKQKNDLNRFASEEPKSSLYEVLDLPIYSSMDEVKITYKKMVLIHHPDKGGNEEYFKVIGYAYSVLGNSDSKQHYDDILKTNSEEQKALFISESFKFYSDKYDNILMENTEQGFKLRTHEKSHISVSSSIPEWMDFYKNPVVVGRSYYIIGRPIRISQCAKVLRDHIPREEIMASFQDIEEVLLIDTASQAINYSTATRVGNFYEDNYCAQSAIAEVRLIQNIYSKPQRLIAYTNEQYIEESGFISSHQNESAIYCIKAKKEDIQLISAKFSVFALMSKPEQFKEYFAGDLLYQDVQPHITQ